MTVTVTGSRLVCPAMSALRADVDSWVEVQSGFQVDQSLRTNFLSPRLSGCSARYGSGNVTVSCMAIARVAVGRRRAKTIATMRGGNLRRMKLLGVLGFGSRDAGGDG